MSLISTASPWINDEPVKKRLPTMRKTVKKMPIDDDQDRSDYQEKDTQDLTDNESKVHNLLEKMTSINTNSDGESLANFQPLLFPTNETLQNKPQQFETQTSNFTPDNIIKSVNATGDLNHIYEDKPYYTSGIGIGKDNNSNSKINDRLGYIVHLLEQQQNERTNNNLEESILYVLLGTFVIFVVDSFSKGGKYIR
jgi:hypothetical protein